MKVYIVGIGMGSRGSLTNAAADAILKSSVVFGAARMNECASSVVEDAGYEMPSFVETISPNTIVSYLEGHVDAGWDVAACVLCSGDTGFFSLATTLMRRLAEMDPQPEIELVPGITTVQHLAARIGRPWQGVCLASAHGRDCNVLAEVLLHEEVFLLTGGDQTPRTIIGDLANAGLGDVEVVVGERLSYEDETITRGTAAELAGRDFDTLSAMWITRGLLCDEDVAPYRGHAGIPDGLFVRGKAPMTKSEVRALVTAKMRPGDGEVVYDIGAGTGSVSIELACSNPRCRVWAIEFKDEAFELLEANRRRFGAFNVGSVKGRAPEAMRGLPAPDAVFVGGSTGELERVLRASLAANPAVRLVLTAVSMETVAQATDVLARLAQEGLTGSYAATQVGITRTREAGRYHLLAPESPVYIFEACGGKNL